MDQFHDDIRFEFKNKNLMASLTWLPLVNDEGEFELKFWDPTRPGNPPESVDPQAKIGIVIKMNCCNSRGSFSSFEQDSDEQGQLIPGVYRISGVNFPKPGEWVFEITLTQSTKDGDQVVVTQDRASGTWIQQ
jgi:hypothetical protein